MIHHANGPRDGVSTLEGRPPAKHDPPHFFAGSWILGIPAVITGAAGPVGGAPSAHIPLEIRHHDNVWYEIAGGVMILFGHCLPRVDRGSSDVGIEQHLINPCATNGKKQCEEKESMNVFEGGKDYWLAGWFHHLHFDILWIFGIPIEH